MIIAISGTPATGKTAVASILAKILKANLISISSLVKAKKIKSYYDRKRRTFVVNERDIKNAIKRILRADKINIVEGHVAHIIKSDKVFVLRCSPPILIKRMRKKGWGAAKIRENIKAEILDVITTEALETSKKSNVIEIDTSTKSPVQTAALIVKILNNYRLQRKYSAGSVDWSERYKKYLTSEDYSMTA